MTDKPKKNETRNKIIKTALQLFNERGTESISTVHILKEMGISPGNLYYYFKNKEEIIREIYELMIQDYQNNWDFSSIDNPDFNIFAKIIGNLRIFFKYRFIMNSMVTLSNNDEILKQRAFEIKAIRQAELTEYFLEMENRGIMDFGHDKDKVKKIVSVLWFVGEFWLMKKELNNEKIEELTREIELEYLDINTLLIEKYLIPENIVHFFKRKEEYLNQGDGVRD